MTHPQRGTCNDVTCPSHGRCHCGCGEIANRHEQARGQNNLAKGYFAGQPYVFRHGHWNRLHSAAESRAYVPISRVRPLARYLRQRLTAHGAAAACGLSFSTFTNATYARAIKSVHPKTARRIVAAVQRLPEYEPHRSRRAFAFERAEADHVRLSEIRREQRKKGDGTTRCACGEPKGKWTRVCESCGPQLAGTVLRGWRRGA